MQFGPSKVEQAAGAILAHATKAGVRLLKKGRVLTSEDVAELAGAGLREVVVARLGPDDVPEDEAATRIASAAAGNGIRVGASFTGRANLYAAANGLALVDAARVDALNRIDESITLASVAPFARATPRQMLATLKIIPFAAPRDAVEAAENLLRGKALVSLAPFAPRRMALISTVLATTKPAHVAKNRSALDRRIEPIGSAVIFERQVAHEANTVAEAIAEAAAAGADPILVFGASAITDRHDVIPAAIELAGGRVEHFGMPVDPGNLLLAGKLGDRNVIGLPGCARSPKLNGFDFVLWRLAAGLPVGRAELSAMGVGGLLGEIPTRPQPRDEPRNEAPRLPKIGAIVLAAGLSSRMGSNKLLARIGGVALVRHAAEAAVASAAMPVVVVTGNEDSKVREAAAGLPVEFAKNDDYSSGLSASLKCGLNSLPEDCDGAIILLGDMPGVGAGLIDKLIAAFDPAEGRAICVATHGGKRGNPVLWSRRFFAEMRALEGDVGAKHLMASYPELVCEVEAPDDAPLTDIDTPEALAAYRERAR